MALASIKNKIKRLQENSGLSEEMLRLADLIDQGAYYDELTEEDKAAYCAYIGQEREAMEQVEMMVTGTLHFQLERKAPPPTREEMARIAEEVQEIIEDVLEENPEEETRETEETKKREPLRKRRRDDTIYVKNKVKGKKSMKTYTLKIPTRPIKTAMEAVAECKRSYEKAREDREALKAGYESGMITRVKYEEDMATLAESEPMATAKALEAINAQAKAYTEAIDSQVTPDGKDLMDNPDYLLLRDSLVDSPEVLGRIIERNAESAAFRVACGNYGQAHGWEGYSGYFVNEKGVREYGEEVFRIATNGAKFPFGYDAMRCETEGEMERIAGVMGVSAEYAQGE